MDTFSKTENIMKWVKALFGASLYALVLNLIIYPLHLYSGNLTGIAQMVSDFIGELVLHKDVNLTGSILYVINIPLLFLAYKKLGKKFFVLTVCIVTFQSMLLQFVPVLKEPLIDDPLTACVIGGILTGYGVGLTLRNGGSGGGTDILGLYFAKKYPEFSVGKVQNLISAVVFLYCLVRYNIEIVIYSIIYLLITSFVIDRVHTQNIKTSVLIFSKKKEVRDCILNDMKRGATCWKGEGCYNQTETFIYMTIISKYEIQKLRDCLHRVDPSAFVILNDDINVDGNFIKRL
ncbi:MAG: YitT family protein [Lachnospiraceae bacterium]|nr:YitT family protein [Lachnospiraceae bacterium]